MPFKTNVLMLTCLSILLLSTQIYSDDRNASMTTTTLAPVGVKLGSKHLKNKPFEVKIVSFPSGDLMLQGIFYKPIGPGPFPSILFNHGSSLETHEASDALGPMLQIMDGCSSCPHDEDKGSAVILGII